VDGAILRGTYDHAVAETIIDESVLQGLADALADRQIVRGIIAVYLNELDTRIDAIAAASPAERAKAAHALKSPSVTLGVVAMHEPSHRIEQSPDDETVLQTELAALRASRAAVVAALTRW
jgi:HPt (histidine-containing phosphotransfer) domain-containing protein